MYRTPVIKRVEVAYTAFFRIREIPNPIIGAPIIIPTAKIYKTPSYLASLRVKKKSQMNGIVMTPIITNIKPSQNRPDDFDIFLLKRLFRYRHSSNHFPGLMLLLVSVSI